MGLLASKAPASTPYPWTPSPVVTSQVGCTKGLVDPSRDISRWGSLLRAATSTLRAGLHILATHPSLVPQGPRPIRFPLISIRAASVGSCPSRSHAASVGSPSRSRAASVGSPSRSRAASVGSQSRSRAAYTFCHRPHVFHSGRRQDGCGTLAHSTPILRSIVSSALFARRAAVTLHS